MDTHKPRKILVGVVVILSCGLVSAGAYAWLRVQVQTQQLASLQQRNALLSDESALWQRRWEEDLRQRDDQIARMEQTLQGLRDAQRLKQLLTDSQERLVRIETDYERITLEKESLEQANIGLNARISSLTRELTKTLNDVKTVRQQLSGGQGNRAVAQLTREMETHKQLLKEKDAAIVSLEAQVRQMRGDASQSGEGGKAIERQLEGLQKDKEKLTAKIDQLTRSYEERLEPVARLKEKIRDLEKQSGEKDKQRQALERELAQAEETRRELERRFENAQKVVTDLQSQAVTQADAQRQRLQEFETIKAEKMQLSLELQKSELRLNAQAQEMMSLRKELERVTADLATQSAARAQMAQRLEGTRQENAPGDGKWQQGQSAEVSGMTTYPPSGELQQELSKAYALYDTAKAQVVKFSELLMDRERELERTKEQLAASQGGRTAVPGMVAVSDQPLTELTKIIVEQERQLQGKDVELTELRQRKNSLEEQLKKREQEQTDLTALSVRLKEQMVQMNEIMVKRESDLVSKNSEVMSLRNQLDRLQEDLRVKQQELDQVRERQALTLEELARATRLNVTLQETLMQVQKDGSRGSASTSDTAQREKADALRREVEKMMGK